jgi:type I restriction enzyme M protein
VDGQPSKRSRGRVDYTLRVKVNPDTQPIAVALIEAKANLLFFTKGRPTEKVWYYDLSAIKVGKKTPLTADHFEEFLRLLPDRADSDHSWTVTRAEIEAKGLDLKAVNPHAKAEEDTRTPEQLLDLIEAKGREVAEALAALHRQ